MVSQFSTAMHVDTNNIKEIRSLQGSRLQMVHYLLCDPKIVVVYGGGARPA